ncbi:7TM diverse intracellular signaling domain-containing protein [Pseudobacteriovorax antillogorgiicola]|uniref:Adenylate cyclase, class 3 n=1 Tax=Pseudobacteriovorax antillogorgiicola TaxID=1513793 RepID=A0A1Y6BDV5_9BACT|nr:7TM diverse intracellular signaling domain-containing protein [Pseudobacteriovorax antillogorgiicola]TCS56375.1 class 3 adenylate cyclase [Pseudobacteriovorax antillogorgiicola]SMF06535.1 Adenylate cyclase, class 3 [Pseudobacteriovorax antillogorgiicola]
MKTTTRKNTHSIIGQVIPFVLVFMLTLLSNLCLGSEADRLFVIHSDAQGPQINQHLKMMSQDSLITPKSAFQLRHLFKDLKVSAVGVQQKQIWLYVTILNPNGHEFIIEYPFPLVDKLDFYQLNDQGKVVKKSAVGDLRPFSNREIKHHLFTFQPDPSLVTSHLLLRFETNSPIITHLDMWYPEPFLSRVRMLTLSLGLCFGGMVTMAVFNFFIFLSARDRYFFYYFLYYISATWSLVGFSGLLVFIDPTRESINWFTNYGVVIGGQVTVVFASIFAISFLNMAESMRFWMRAMQFCSALAILAIIACLATDLSPEAVEFTIVSGSLASITIIVASISASIRKYRLAQYFTAAWLLLVIGNLSFMGTTQGLIPINDLTMNLQNIGVALEGLILSIALGYRLNLERKKTRTEMNQKYHYHKQLDKVFYPHQLSQMEGGLQLEETMPVNSSSACVIFFDIQDSSRLGYNINYEFFEAVMKRCHRLMISYYDPHELVANAFMIKEVGDGFLCSIGFPFKSPGSIYDNAVLLADQFNQILYQLARTHFQDREILSSIGIAAGEIKGSFPKIGMKQYDVFGDAIIKANRYESMRRVLIQKQRLKKGSITIISDEVYKNLSADLQDDYTKLDLHGLRIRDDEEARWLYYKYFNIRQVRIGVDHSKEKNQIELKGA